MASAIRAKAKSRFPSRAIELVNTRLSVSPGDPFAVSSLALYSARLGNRDFALARIAEAIKTAPRNRDVLFNSALLYEITGRRGEALAALKNDLGLGESKDRIRRQPEFAELRRDPRCTEYMSKEVCNGRTTQ